MEDDGSLTDSWNILAIECIELLTKSKVLAKWHWGRSSIKHRFAIEYRSDIEYKLENNGFLR